MIKLCDYGCGHEAKYYFKYAKKWCCENFTAKCQQVKKLNSLNHMKDNISTPIKTSKLCSYGCGKIAKYLMKGSKKLCCCKTPQSCDHMRYINWYIHRTTLNDLSKKYPFFIKIETPRENNKGEIEVQCKQCGRWFKPEREQLRSRICHLEHDDGNSGSYLYCSQICKEKCPSFNIKYINASDNESLYSTQEYKIWKKEVFNRQLIEHGFNKCEICGNILVNQLVPHHKKPIATHPHLSLDPDNSIILCGNNSINKCHSKIHNGEYSSYVLNLKKCKKGR